MANSTYHIVSLAFFRRSNLQTELIVANGNAITLSNLNILTIYRVFNTLQGNNLVDILCLNITQVNSLIAHLDRITFLHHQVSIRNSLKQLVVEGHLTSPVGCNRLTDFCCCGLFARIVVNQA